MIDQQTPEESMEREALQELQLSKLRLLLTNALKNNAFYRDKLCAAGVHKAEDIASMADYADLPFTTRAELSADQLNNPPYGTNLSFPAEQYTRIHQTSGTTGRRLRWLDTVESWAWWGRCWAQVYNGAGVGASDRIFFAFSFGPFVGLWSGFEGARTIGALSIPGGGMSSEQRLEAIVENRATVLVCTPTYALHLAEVATDKGIDIGQSAIRTTIHAGEPGVNLPATRARIENAWGARAFDHAGATEVGAWGFECAHQADLHLNEGEFIFEVIDPESGETADEGELVISNLGRHGMPVIRYRTGDQVHIERTPCACGRTFQRLKGGVIGRVDDALIVRGIVLYPSSIENVVRQFPEVVEFAVDVYRRRTLDELQVRVELSGGDDEKIKTRLHQALSHHLGLRAQVDLVKKESLPRFELKARRFTDHRSEA